MSGADVVVPPFGFANPIPPRNRNGLPGPDFRLWQHATAGPRGSRDEVEQLRSFASFAFSEDGIPELQILALGDFCHGGRYGRYNVVYCRNLSVGRLEEETFLPLEEAGPKMRELFDRNMDMFAACPSEPIMRW